MTRILFIGESWQGSSARSLREALALRPGMIITDIGEDHFLSRSEYLPLRIANRLLRPLQVRELTNVVFRTLHQFQPDVVLVYKGVGVRASLLRAIQREGVPVVNAFPDCSPQAHGPHLGNAMGCYDLVISTKIYHPPLWRSTYGYSNPCVCVPHGYDPAVDYWSDPSPSQTYDVALCCTWRPEYHRLMESLGAALGDSRVSVAIAGRGWPERSNRFPGHWRCIQAREGRAYGEFLRSARIVIAPLNREMWIRGVRQPGDEDTTRTYQLAAAYCFFLHQRSEYMTTVYDEQHEVPFWSDAAELANLVKRWLPDEAGRRAMAKRAHVRAVPAYSIPERASLTMRHIEEMLKSRRALGSRR